MRIKPISLISIALMLSLASVTYGIVIGNWEQDMDGWEICDLQPPGNPVLTYSSIGATLDSNSLRMSVDSGWKFALIFRLQNAGLVEEFFNHNIFAIDVTRIADEWTGSEGNSQLIMIVNANPGIWDDYGGAGTWNPTGGDNTQTVIWDYSNSIPKVDPDGVSWLEFVIVTNYPAAYTTGGVFYLDNARLLGSGNDKAHDPYPANGELEIQRDPVLIWGSGNFAETHDLYFGTDFDEVNDADMESMSSNVTVVSLDVNSYSPGTLDFETTYFWRADEFGGSDYWKGPVWSFTTGNFLVVEDFEDYNDYEPYTVWNSWIDGYGDPTNGSTAGYSEPDFIGGEHYLESEIVHSGHFSMPLSYDNSVGNSEVTMTLSSQRDWTAEDVQSLSLRFYGSVSNAVEQMYVAVANSTGNPAVVYNDHPDALEAESWTEWSIKLSEFENQGINLTDVDKISIGFGDRDNPSLGGSGRVFIDDIRLYKSRCILANRSADFAKVDYAPLGALSGDCVIDYRELEIMANDWLMGDQLITTANPSTNGLVAYYPLNEGTGTSASDTSGNNHNGTLAYDASWVSPGIMGSGAIRIDGSAGSKINIGIWNPSAGTGQMTLSVWARWAGPHDGSDHQGLIGKRDSWESDGLSFMFEIDTTDSNDALAIRQYTDADTDVYSADGSMTQYIGSWMHAAVTFDGTTATLYVNGQEAASGPFTFGNMPNASMAIGNTNGSAGWDASPEVFNGDLDEIRIFNRALSAAEIAYLADTTPGDDQLHISVQSPAELYEGEAPGSRKIDFKDFAVLADMWLEDML